MEKSAARVQPSKRKVLLYISFSTQKTFLCKKTESLSWKEAARGKLNPLKQIFVIQIMELQRTHRGQIFEFLQGKTNWIFC